MTTNQTIDGVPRDSVLQLIEFLADAKAYHKVVIGRCEDCVKSGESSEREEYGRIGYRTEKIEQVERLSEELRALLDAQRIVCRNGILCQNSKCTECGGNGSYSAALPDASEVLVVPLTGPKEWIDSIKPAARPQGEPVGEVVHVSEDQIRIGLYDAYSLKVGDLVYAEQPAPVAVVLPERMEVPRGDLQPFERAEAKKWNACLDEVTRLNKKPSCCGSCPGGCVIQAASK